MLGATTTDVHSMESHKELVYRHIPPSHQVTQRIFDFCALKVIAETSAIGNTK
jgi:hypothetical protein